MLRSMFAGVSGLRSHQTMMDVVGNNIANVNTTGYKSSRVTFMDTLSQLQRGASGGAIGDGGVNPQQVGLGVKVGAIDTVTTQGSVQSTGRSTDVAIQGEGYFVVRNGPETLYTRSGAFGLDSAGNLVDPTGYLVRGYAADANGVVNPNGPLTDIRLPLGQSIAPKATDNVTVGGNLKAGAVTGETVVTSIDVFDAQGKALPVTFTFTKDAAANSWTLSARDRAGAAIAGTPATVTFGPNGQLATPANGKVTFAPGAGATPTPGFTLDLGLPGGTQSLTQFGGVSSATALDQDGQATGTLRSFAVGNDGTVSGVFSNGESKALAQLALASFANAGGLVKEGDNHMRADNNSGLPQIGTPGGAGKGNLAAGTLEMSNVDLAQEFTNLIIAQRGFQANSRIISTSDELLQELVNLKR